MTSVLLLVLQLVTGDAAVDSRPSVTFRLTGIEVSPTSPVTIHARNATGADQAVDFVMDGNETSVSLPAGQWFVRADREGYWGESVLVSVTDKLVDVVLTLRRATPLRAAVTLPSRGAARTVDVHFSPSDATSGHPASSATCPVTDGRLVCEIPSGVYDLAFRIPGYASVYKWNVDLRSTSVVDAGSLVFRTGSTLSGRVEVNDTEPRESLERAVVRLRAVSAGPRSEEMRSRESLTALAVRPNARGLFSFNVLPGTYIVSATARELVSEEREVTLTDGRESVLNDPLVLSRPATLTVNVQLPAEGASRAWKVALVQLGATTPEGAEQIVSVSPDRVVRFTRQPGTYDVELRLADSVWAAQRIVLDRDATLDLAARVTKVRGSIQLGDEPLTARVVFTENTKGIYVPVQARDGAFLAFLPETKDDRWTSVEIQSEQPWVKRVIEDVTLERDDDGEATFDIRLPASRIEGVVVDEHDRPVVEGVLKMTGPEGSQQADLSNASFAFHGLQQGRYVLSGYAPDRETGEPVIVDIDSDDTMRSVVVRVAPASELQGSVVSASGPVIGASVFVMPENHAHPIVVPMPVDAAGQFRFRLPPGTRDIVAGVSAPGFAFRMMRMPAPETKLDLAVDQHGGHLTIDGLLGAGAEPLRPYVMHNGAILTALITAYLAHGRFAANFDERVHFDIPSAEEGLYTLCLLTAQEEQQVRRGGSPPQARCTSGVLTRHGALTLRAPDPK